MFVQPAPTEPSAFWSDVAATERFVLQQSGSMGGAILRSVLATIQNVLETKPPPYRIVYRHNAASTNYILLAVGESTAEIDADWKWLADKVMPVVAELDEAGERANFVVTKIRFLASEEGGQDVAADRQMRAAATTFRQTFSVGKAENLVTYYSCALHGGFMLHQGWLYLSENYFCFYSYMFGSEKRIMLPLRDIKDLAKARSMGGTRDDAIEVVAKDGVRYTFSNLFRRDETFDMLSQLTSNTMDRVLLNSEYAQQQQTIHRSPSASAINPDTRLPEHRSAPSAAAAVGLQGVPLAERIARQRRNEEFRGEFGLPRGEELLSVIEVATFAPHNAQAVYRGRLYLSTSFVCYMARNARGCRITLPLAAVRRIERANAVDADNIRCYELILTVWHQMTIAFKVPLGASSECDRWCDALRGQLRAMVDEQHYAKANRTALTRYTLKAFCRTCASESLLLFAEPPGGDAGAPPADDMHVDCLGRSFGFPGDAKTQKEDYKRKLWIKYMRESGRNLTLVRRAEFDRLIRVGLPNCLRGEIWELSSGAMHLRFQNRGVYEKYVNDYLDQPGPCADEIEKDLNRSLPEYAGYQSPEGIDALRRVLNAYALRDAELGYCQAMNIVASTMLIFMTEEQVFWTLTVMCDRLVPGYYSPSMYGATLDQSIFQTLVEETMPLLATHVKQNDIQLSIACLPWFLTLFVNSMPLVYALRVLDCFFLEGPRILFQIGLAILKINGGALLDATDDGTFLHTLKEYYATLGDLAYPESKSARARQVTRFHELLYVAYSDFPGISHGRIVELRRSHQLRIVHSVEEFSKRTFLRSVIDASGFTKEQLSLLYDRYYSVLFYSGGSGGGGSGGSPGREASSRITVDVCGFARFMYEISSWMRVQIKESQQRSQNHRNADISDAKRRDGSLGRRAGAADKTKADDTAKEVAASLENPGWFIASLFRYTSRIVPPRRRINIQDADSEASSAALASAASEHGPSEGPSDDGSSNNVEDAAIGARPAAVTPLSASVAPSDAAIGDDTPLGDLRVSFQQCVIALGRIVNTDLLTRMDVFFDMYAATVPGQISRREMFQLSEAILYIGHGEDVEVGGARSAADGEDITNEEHLLRSVSDFLRRAVAHGEMEEARQQRDPAQPAAGADFVLSRNIFRVVVLEDEMLERFFSDMVPLSFRFTDGVELANPKRAISTHLPSTPLTPRGTESASARLLASGRAVAEGMSARVAQTIALGGQFVDQNVLAPIVRGAVQVEAPAPASGPTRGPQGGFAVSEELARVMPLSNAPTASGVDGPDEDVAEHMVHLSLEDDAASGEHAATDTQLAGDGPAGQSQELQPPSPPPTGQWTNVPQELASNSPYDPYENLLDEVDQLLGEIKDNDDDAAPTTPAAAAPKTKPKRGLDLQLDGDDDDDDDDLTRLLND
ncbi:GTPase activating protein (GAP) [Coemansia spiralis]|nr:GTPase activating protein (GAP) [Coemansia spiralis]